MATEAPVNWCAQHQNQFPCDLTAFNAAFIGAIASLAGGIMVVCLNLRVRKAYCTVLEDVPIKTIPKSHSCFLLLSIPLLM